MEQIVFKITNIQVFSKEKIEISIKVQDKNIIGKSVEKFLKNAEENNETLELINDYTFIINPRKYSMTPNTMELSKCFDVFHEHEYCNNLNPTLRRKWKTADIVDKLTSYFFENTYFKNKIYKSLLTIDDISDSLIIEDKNKQYEN